MIPSSYDLNFKNASFGVVIMLLMGWSNNGFLVFLSILNSCLFDSPESNINSFASAIENVSNV